MPPGRAPQGSPGTLRLRRVTVDLEAAAVPGRSGRRILVVRAWEARGPGRTSLLQPEGRRIAFTAAYVLPDRPADGKASLLALRRVCPCELGTSTLKRWPPGGQSWTVSTRTTKDLRAFCAQNTMRRNMLIFVSLAASPAATGTAGMGRPALGFNNCNLQCCNATMPSADFVMRTADLLVSKGLRDAGYAYLNMDVRRITHVLSWSALAVLLVCDGW